jgi:hypothetical protein
LSYRYRRANEPGIVDRPILCSLAGAGTGFGFITTGLFAMRNSCWVVTGAGKVLLRRDVDGWSRVAIDGETANSRMGDG